MNCYIKPEIQRLINLAINEGTLITLEKYNELFMNSYERAAIYPHLTNEALIEVCRNHMSNFSYPTRNPTTYEESALHLIFPLLTQRLSIK